MIKVRFPYFYKNSAADGYGPMWEGQFPTLQDFLKHYKMTDLGVNTDNSSYRIAEQEFSLEGMLPTLLLDKKSIRDIRVQREFFITDSGKQDAVCVQVEDVAGTPPGYRYVGNAEGRWFALKEERQFLFEIGTFNERFSGPYTPSMYLQRIAKDLLARK
jgi:hypothetical protein